MVLRDLIERLSPGSGRVLTALSLFVRSLPQQREELGLLRSLCDALSAVGYCRVLIGRWTNTHDMLMYPLVQSQPHDALREEDLSWGRVSAVQGAEDTPFRPVTPILARNILLDPRYATWRDEAAAAGYRAAVAFPVASSGEPPLVLAVYSADPQAFNEIERGLLETLVGHLALNLESLHQRIALARSERRYRHLVENIEDIVFALDGEGRLTYVSPAVKRLAGWDPTRCIGNRLVELVGSANTASAQCLMEEVLAGRMYSEEWRVGSESAGRHVLRVSVIPEDHDADEFVGIARDITEQKKAEEELRVAFEGTIRALGAITVARDPYTANHQERVAELASAIAEEMALDQNRIRVVQYAGLVHDIGKMSIPSEILTKPSRLTEAEWSLFISHPETAYEILRKIRFPWPLAEIALQHHERMDGSGYPRALAGDEILLEARILGVADVVEAMGSHRPYRPSRGHNSALQEIAANRGTLYDAEVVDACLRVFRRGSFRWND
ncbi:MAG: HD domain-containing phosphohydrolase [Thermotogota bacterium]